MTQRDFMLVHSGNIVLLRPLTDAARYWIEENLPADRMTFGGSVVIEHRYVDPIANGIVNDGLTIN